jgi:hypothetical protein
MWTLRPIRYGSIAIQGMASPISTPRSSAFHRSALPEQLPAGCFTDLGWRIFDMALLQETHVSESKVLEFRMETFNTFNHAQFFGANSVDGTPSGPQRNVAAPDAGSAEIPVLIDCVMTLVIRRRINV